MQKVIDIIEKSIDVPFGFCPFSEVAEHLLDCRAKSRLPKDAKTVICFAFPYKVEDKAPKNISRYAAVPDYHEICGNLLAALAEKLRGETGCEFEYFVDNSPVPEVFAAARAGLGVIGENGLLITEQYGSFVFLGEIVTDMELCGDKGEIAHCSACGACKKACPVGLSKSECLSAVTQKKKPLSMDEQKLIRENGSVWGCDICQNVCPMNSGTQKTKIPEFLEGYRDSYERGEDISGRAYCWRGEAVISRNFLLFENIADVIAPDTPALNR
ncbi:MAG: epoxyqueuosine reductase [Clostridia bacterium]|nr:epoxyqueuosine reductase [Clostridia bacterium]